MGKNFLSKQAVWSGAAVAAAFCATFASETRLIDGIPMALGQMSAAPQQSAHTSKTRDHVLQLSDQLSTEATAASLDQALLRKLQSIEPAAQSKSASDAVDRAISQDRSNDFYSSKPLYRLHLASVTSEADVDETIQSLKKYGSPELIGANFSTLVSTSSDESSTFTRIFAGEFISLEYAQDACWRLKSDGQYCSVLKVSR